jgi:c-di-GMP-related signal transduction protein
MVHVARQAILDARGHVVGYELLYRGSVRDTACIVEGDVAGATVLTGAMLDLRLETLTDGRTPFIDITRRGDHARTSSRKGGCDDRRREGRDP